MENTKKRIGGNHGCDICKLTQSGLLQNDLTGQQPYPSLKLQLVKTERMPLFVFHPLWRSCPKSGKSAFHQNFENIFFKLHYVIGLCNQLNLKNLYVSILEGP